MAHGSGPGPLPRPSNLRLEARAGVPTLCLAVPFSALTSSHQLEAAPPPQNLANQMVVPLGVPGVSQL